MAGRCLLLVCILLLCTTASWGQAYTTKFDKVDVDAVLSNDRVLDSYVKCFLHKGPCTPEGREGRKAVPEIFQTACGKCSPQQKKMVRKAMLAFRSRRKDQWEQLVDRYDPGRRHYKQLEAFLKQT